MSKGVPNNPKLYDALESQAKARYPKHRGKGNSPQANKMLSQQWAAVGGTFVPSLKDVDPKNRDFKKEEENRNKARASRKKREMKKKNFVV
jgi:hypothetical protein